MQREHKHGVKKTQKIRVVWLESVEATYFANLMFNYSYIFNFYFYTY